MATNFPTFLLLTLLQFSILSVVFGDEAQPHAHPYVVDIRHYVGSPHYHWCGGVIIDADWVLTAANCVSKTDLVIAGDHDVSIVEGTEQIRTVAFTARHPNYTYPGNSGFNVALVKVNQPFEFNQNVSPAILKTSNMIIPDNANAISVGWSSESNDGYYQNILQVSQRQVQNDGLCNDGLSNEHQRICFTQGDASCAADQGSPLLCDTINAGRVLCGIANGQVCGLIQSVYRVDIFSDWIIETMKRN